MKRLLALLISIALFLPAQAFAGFASTTWWEVQTGGSDTSNGGGFDPANANFATDLTATSGTGSAPVVSSASYNFVSTDVGHWLFVQSGTNWRPGWYQIASVASNAATLTASSGSGVSYASYQGPKPTTVAGVASTASPSGGVWAVDYSQTTSGAYGFLDLVIGGTNTQITSSGHPFGKAHVGNTIAITGGGGFTVQTVQISSVSGTTATCDKAVGTASSTGGTGGLGGCLATPGFATTQHVANNTVNVKSGTYTLTSTANGAGGRISETLGGANSFPLLYIGYNSVRGDGGTKPILKAGSGSMTVVTLNGGSVVFDNFEIQKGTQTTILGIALTSGGDNIVRNCKLNALDNGGINAQAGNTRISNCYALSISGGTGAFYSAAGAYLIDSSVADSCSVVGFYLRGNPSTAYRCLATNGSAHGFELFDGGSQAINCTAYGLTGVSTDGFFGNSDSNTVINCYAEGCGRYGFNVASKVMSLSNCAAYNNSTANTHSLVSMLNVGFQTLTASGLNNPGSGDYSPNKTASAGALLRAGGWPATLPGVSTSNYDDIGVAQHVDPTSGGFVPGPITLALAKPPERSVNLVPPFLLGVGAAAGAAGTLTALRVNRRRKAA
jgi:hypothetical protein